RALLHEPRGTGRPPGGDGALRAGDPGDDARPRPVREDQEDRRHPAGVHAGGRGADADAEGAAPRGRGEIQGRDRSALRRGRRVKARIRKAAVLGAGTMGAQVAAHLAGCGLDVVLLDMASPGPDRSAIARKGLEVLRKLKPSPLHRAEDLAFIRPGNFDDDLGLLAGAEWVFEAVVEDAEIKRKLYARVAPALSATALLTTNTSGLGIAGLAEALPAALRPRFFGTHFFNPPRYLHLLETIAGPQTDPALIGGLEAFAEAVLGKGVVRAKDTPNFIANRIGSYGFGVVLQAMMDLDLGIDDVDALTGPAIGRAKSATFRTADIAGVDICVKVAEHLYQ